MPHGPDDRSLRRKSWGKRDDYVIARGETRHVVETQSGRRKIHNLHSARNAVAFDGCGAFQSAARIFSSQELAWNS
jgi:hypothetical protein